MAEVVDAMPRARIGSPSVYPWNEWMDGRVWKLKSGTDFKCSPRSIAMMASTRSRTRGGTAITRVDGDHVYIQFVRGKAKK